LLAPIKFKIKEAKYLLVRSRKDYPIEKINEFKKDFIDTGKLLFENILFEMGKPFYNYIK
jgi:hypothetical protein